MTTRFAPLLAAALACLAAPALAQDDYPAEESLPEAGTDLPPPAEPAWIEPETVAPAEGWQGEWQGDWAEDGTYHGTWSGTYSDPGPTAARAIYPGGVAGAGYPSAERVAWLNQCRNAYYPASASTGAVVASGQPDVCEAYLQQYERSYAMAAQGGAYAQGANATGPYAPGGYPPGVGGYGSPYAPVLWVRVPIIREPVTAGE